MWKLFAQQMSDGYPNKGVNLMNLNTGVQIHIDDQDDLEEYRVKNDIPEFDVWISVTSPYTDHVLESNSLMECVLRIMQWAHDLQMNGDIVSVDMSFLDYLLENCRSDKNVTCLHKILSLLHDLCGKEMFSSVRAITLEISEIISEA